MKDFNFLQDAVETLNRAAILSIDKGIQDGLFSQDDYKNATIQFKDFIVGPMTETMGGSTDAAMMSVVVLALTKINMDFEKIAITQSERTSRHEQN